MFEDLIFIVAAIATIAAFIFDVWRYWKERHSSTRLDDAERRKKGSSVVSVNDSTKEYLLE